MPNFAQNDDQTNRTTRGSTLIAISAFGTCISRSLRRAWTNWTLSFCHTAQDTKHLQQILHDISTTQDPFGSRLAAGKLAENWMLRLVVTLEIEVNECSLDFRELLNLDLERFSDGVRLLKWQVLWELDVNLWESKDHMRWACYNLTVGRYDSCPTARFVHYNYHLLYILSEIIREPWHLTPILPFYIKHYSITAGTEKLRYFRKK